MIRPPIRHLLDPNQRTEIASKGIILKQLLLYLRFHIFLSLKVINRGRLIVITTVVDDVYRRNLLSAAQEKIMKINQENSGTQLSVHIFTIQVKHLNKSIAALESFDLSAFSDFI